MKARTIQILSIALFALLLVWGIYTFITYLGIPYHGAALLTDSAAQAVTSSCDASAYVCRGIATLEPFVLHTFERASPFLWYAIICVVIFAIFVAWQRLMMGRKTILIRWKPWKILLIFIGCVWLISTVLSNGTANGRPERLYIEPTKDTYNVSDTTLATLQQDYQTMLSRGCLDPAGQTQSGAQAYTMKTWCIEEAFVTRVLSQMLFIFVLLAEFLILGRMLLQWIMLKPPRFLARLAGMSRDHGEYSGLPSMLAEGVFSLGLGACAMIVILWIVAITGFYVSTPVWIIAILIPLLGFKHTRYWLNAFLFRTWEREYSWYDVTLLLGWLLLSYLALNFLEVVRPFPIGWDDLGSYLNRPRLLVSYGHFIFSMSPFDWTYLTSLGFLLFGYNATFGSTAAMMVNWSEGLLALLTVFAFARTFLGKRAGVLSALLYYTLPLVGHFSFADMKIDNAVFCFGALTIFALLLAVRGHDELEEDDPVPHHPRPLPLLFLSGLFIGFAFSTKSTATIVLFAALAMLAGIVMNAVAFVGALFFAFSVFAQQGVFSLPNIIQRLTGTAAAQNSVLIFIVVCLLATLACLLAALWRRKTGFKQMTWMLLAFFAGVFIAVFPWIEHNNIENGKIIPSLELSAPNRLSPGVNIETLKGDLALNMQSPECKPTGSIEELDRYWGFDQGWGHYLTLPWRTVMNIDSTGYYVTTVPALLLFPLILLLPYFWTKKGRWLRWLACGTFMMVLEWIFLANGVPWYGVGILLGIVVGLEALVIKAPDKPNRIAAGTLIGLSIMIGFAMRFWQVEQQRNIFEYSMGKISDNALREITIPYYDGITATVVDRHQSIPDRPYLYRIGTFIPYFIPKNLEIIGIADAQLDAFNCLYQERNPDLTVRRLKALGFNSIIFDTNTSTIEQDPNGTLHKKVSAFVDFVNNPAAKLQVAISDTNAGIAFILIP